MLNLKGLMFSNAVDTMMKENIPDSYRYAVFDVNGLVEARAGGYSRKAIDFPEMKAQVTDRNIICSLSKTVTAAAVLSVLQEKGLTPDALLAPFLPTDWQPSAEVQQLTFRDFLTHKTGFHQDDNDPKAKQDGLTYDQLKDLLSKAPLKPMHADAEYRNMNYAIFRVVLPILKAYNRFDQTIDTFVRTTPASFSDYNSFLASQYVKIVNDHVLSRSGVAPAGCDPRTIRFTVNLGPIKQGKYVPALAYRFKSDKQGLDLGDRTYVAGSEGWCLSVLDFGRILHTLFYTEAIISEKMRAALLNPNFGPGCGTWTESYTDKDGHPDDKSSKMFGIVHSHGGWIPMETGKPYEAQYCSFWYYFKQQNIIIVALSNSGQNPDVFAAKGNWDYRTKAAFVAMYS